MKTKLFLLALLISVCGTYAQENGYTKLERNLDGVGGLQTGWFTVFTNLDLNFADARFSRYLQNGKPGMTVDEASVKITPTSFSIKYIPRVASKTEWLNVHYTLNRTKGRESMYKSDDGTTAIITKVEITGTPELILKLFIHYWQYKMNVEDNKEGELANYTVMGDRVSLVRININSSKITITPKAFDYNESFGIE